MLNNIILLYYIMFMTFKIGIISRYHLLLSKV